MNSSKNYYHNKNDNMKISISNVIRFSYVSNLLAQTEGFTQTMRNA